MVKYHGSAIVFHDDPKQLTMMKYDFATRVETRYLRHLELTCIDVALLDAEEKQLGEVYDYSKAFKHL